MAGWEGGVPQEAPAALQAGGQLRIPEDTQGPGDSCLAEVQHPSLSAIIYSVAGGVQGRGTQWGGVSTEPPLLPGTGERGQSCLG